MKTVKQVLAALKKHGDEQTRKTYLRHGAPEENFFGVKVSDLKPIAKLIKGNQELALELYATGNSDAMYLAGLVANGAEMTKKQLDDWAKQATWYMISEFTVPGVAAEHPDAEAIAKKWMKAKREAIASCGWCTYSGVLATRSDEELDLKEISQLLVEVGDNIHSAKNRVRHCMNHFVIAVGSYVAPLHQAACETAEKIGEVTVDMGDTACKVPLATTYIEKVAEKGRVGKKRKTARC